MLACILETALGMAASRPYPFSVPLAQLLALPCQPDEFALCNRADSSAYSPDIEVSGSFLICSN